MFPFDWQFAVVTLVAAGALWILVRRFAPAKKAGGPGASVAGRGEPACAHCTTSEQHRASAPHRAPRTTTTPVVSLSDLRETARKH
jgi:hypothetical protein